MILGIDASNIKDGGGLTHLKELLENVEPRQFGFTKVILWSLHDTLIRIEDKDWLVKIKLDDKYRNFFQRWYWQKFSLSSVAKNEKCSILFIPGSSFSGSFRPFVTLSQNLLPFEWKELGRYGLSKATIRLMLLYFFQKFTFLRANGIIFLTDYARKTILTKIRAGYKSTEVISHGINPKFFRKPRTQKEYDSTDQQAINLLYVSFIGEYKHQWNVVKAVKLASDVGWNIKLNLVGNLTERKAANKLFSQLKIDDQNNQYVNLVTNVSYESVQDFYKSADIFIFASTCENLPNILLEAMAAGLPILSSSYGPMPEVLGNAGIYFDPLSPVDIRNKLIQLIENKKLRSEIALNAYQKAQQFTWKKTSEETFKFLFSSILS